MEIDLNNIQRSYSADLDSIQSWCDEIYETKFAEYFKSQRELFNRLKSKSRPITDEELEWILTEVPMNLFDVSEKLNSFQMNQEIIKLELKGKESELLKSCQESSQDKKRESVSNQLIGDKILLLAYNNVLARVEREMSYSRELIMSAKKIYDRRRETEHSNPVSEINPGDDLPDYSNISNKRYIK